MNRETGLQQAVLTYLSILEKRNLGWFMRTNSFAGFIERANGSKGFIKNNKTGAPDIIGVYKGQFIALELKVGKNTLSPAQKLAQAAILTSGGRYLVVRSLDDVVSELREF